jgi:mono/diheme cytochrome c family protein
VRLASVAAALAILALTGCGGGSSAPPHHINLTAFEQEGKTLFISKCGACHTLADAGTAGSAGTVLDSPWQTSRVLETIADGPGSMTENLVTGRSAAAVAAYVAAATK